MSALADLRVRARLHRPDAGVFEDVGGAWIAVLRAEAEDIRTRYTLRMRRHDAVAPGWRIVMGPTRLRVLARAAEGRRWLTLDCVQDFS